MVRPLGLIPEVLPPTIGVVVVGVVNPVPVPVPVLGGVVDGGVNVVGVEVGVEFEGVVVPVELALEGKTQVDEGLGSVVETIAVLEKSQVPAAWPFFWK